MERDGWIIRVAMPSDRRKKPIRPTPQGRPVWKKIMACIHRVRARATQGIDPKEIERAKAVLAAMQENLRPAKLVGEAV